MLFRSAIEQGIITPTTKERLEELEEERRDLEGQIAREEMKKPLLTKERIMYWLESFKRGDIKDVEYQRRIIDTLVNSVYVYDDGDKGRKLVLTFNISGNNTLTISSSDIERTAPPNQKSEPLSEGTEVRIFLVCSWYCRGLNSKRRMHDPWSIICSCVAQRSTT